MTILRSLVSAFVALISIHGISVSAQEPIVFEPVSSDARKAVNAQNVDVIDTILKPELDACIAKHRSAKPCAPIRLGIMKLKLIKLDMEGIRELGPIEVLDLADDQFDKASLNYAELLLMAGSEAEFRRPDYDAMEFYRQALAIVRPQRSRSARWLEAVTTWSMARYCDRRTTERKSCQFEQAEPFFLNAVDILAKDLPDYHFLSGHVFQSYAEYLEDDGRTAQALLFSRKALESADKVEGWSVPFYYFVASQIAGKAGELEEAIAYGEKALGYMLADDQSDPELVAFYFSPLIKNFLSLQEYARAGEFARHRLDFLKRKKVSGITMAMAKYDLYSVRKLAGRCEDCIAFLADAVRDHWDDRLAMNNGHVVGYLVEALGDELAASNRLAEAESAYRKAIVAYSSGPYPPIGMAIERAYPSLAATLLSQKRALDEARTLLKASQIQTTGRYLDGGSWDAVQIARFKERDFVFINSVKVSWAMSESARKAREN